MDRQTLGCEVNYFWLKLKCLSMFNLGICPRLWFIIESRRSVELLTKCWLCVCFTSIIVNSVPFQHNIEWWIINYKFIKTFSLIANYIKLNLEERDTFLKFSALLAFISSNIQKLGWDRLECQFIKIDFSVWSMGIQFCHSFIVNYKFLPFPVIF